MKKNEIYKGKVIGYGSSGEGVIKNEEYTIFVPFTALNEQIEYKVLKVDKKIAYGKLLRVLTSVDDRKEPECPVFGKCGGCNLMHLKYSTQLDIKRNLIKDCFFKIAHIDVEPLLTVESEPCLYYRNKLQMPVREENGVVKMGFFAPDSHRIVETYDCKIHGEWCKGVIAALKECIEKYNVTAYNESTNKGLLRHLVVKKCGDEFMVILVINGEKITFADRFIKLLSEVFCESKFSLYLNVNKGKNNVISGERFIKIYGSEVIEGNLDGIKFISGPQSFMQVNDDIRNKIYKKAIEFACYKPDLTIIDAFCGGGLMSAMLAKRCKKVIGVEIVEEAVDNARRLAKENSIYNLNFICGACEDVLPSVLENESGEISIVLDPARKGLEKSLAEYLAELINKSERINRIVYISCNPATLARDVGIICGTLSYEGNSLKSTVNEPVKAENAAALNGFKIDYVCGYDMFAQTKGVETLCVLTKI